MLLFYLSSGLFLGWSLGANDAANVFGTAVGTRMLRFRTAALVSGIFVIIGAVVQGAGATDTLTSLGRVDALAGSFAVALSAGLAVFLMTRSALPVSTSQAIVGGIIGWNLYTNNPTDYDTLIKILSAWVSGPILGGIFAILIYSLFGIIFNNIRINLLKLNAGIKSGLLLVGAFGAYSLGANNIANVMGVFVPAAETTGISILGISFSGAQQLFFLGGLAIAVGIFTYSKRIMNTVGNQIYKLSAEAAIVVVLAHSLVLFIFSSQSLQQFLTGFGLPPIPLVPVSSSQVIVGSVIGIGLLKGGRGLNFGIMGKIALGWVATPVITAAIAFFILFFVDNVFQQRVSEKSAEETAHYRQCFEKPSGPEKALHIYKTCCYAKRD